MSERSPDADTVERAVRAGLPGPLPSDSLSFFRRQEREQPQPAGGLAPGKVVGDFRLVALIGQGGMGQVWEAEQISLGRRHVAVKFVRPERVTARQLELFAREARAGGRLSHPGIVGVHGYGESDGLAWIAMEFVSGAWTLRDFLDEIARATEVPAGYDQHVARFVGEVADAMQAAHEGGVIHRDLKPQNILIAPDEHPKITDFGLARITDESAMSQTGDFAGTYFYMSPEQVTARRMGIDHRTDVFSLGIVLYEMLALQRPFQGDTTHQVAAQIVTKDPPDPRSIRSKVPRDLAVIANHALEKDRDKRYATMKEFAADLGRYLADEPIHATPPTRLDRAVKWSKRNPTKSTAAGIAAVAFVAITLLLVENVRARNDLSASNQALASKTTEALTSATEARENARVARTNEQRAEKKTDEVLRLSALQKLDELVAEADRLWPANTQNIARYEAWLTRARALVSELPTHEAKLAELRAKAHPWTEEDKAAARASSPLLPDLEATRRERDYLRQRMKALQSGPPDRDPTPAEVGVDFALLPPDAESLERLAKPMVDADRSVFGNEERGLVLARKAFALATEPGERVLMRNTLAWALLANGRIDEAVTEEEQALQEAPQDLRARLEQNMAQLQAAIDVDLDPSWRDRTLEKVSALEVTLGNLENAISVRPASGWQFDSSEDKWWHTQLWKLIDGLGELERGLLAEDCTTREYGWSIPKRLAFARSIETRSISGAENEARWADAVAAIRDSSRSPKYAGLVLHPQQGLLPIGPDPDSGLWEFAHLQTGLPAERDTNGKLSLQPETGLVFVLLPGGTFLMGCQKKDPNGINYDPDARNQDYPVSTHVDPFFCSKYEMTQAQWMRFVGANPSFFTENQYNRGWSRSHRLWSSLHPVEQVGWGECKTTVERLGLALPTEAQWEYAARAGTSTIWWSGNDRESLRDVCNVADGFAQRFGGENWVGVEQWLDDGNTCHAPVGEYRANGFGLHDVIGNVWEWCLDAYYNPAAGEDPLWHPSTTNRVFRGGGFKTGATGGRSGANSDGAPENSDAELGLRPVRCIEQ